MSLFTRKPAAAPAAAPAKFGPFTLPGAKPEAPSKPGAKGTIFGRTPAPKPIKGGKAVKLDLKRGATKKAGKQAQPTDFFKDLREDDNVALAGLAAVAGGTVFAAGLLGLAFFNASAGSGEGAAAAEEVPKITKAPQTVYVTPQSANGATATKPGASVEIIGKATGGIDATPFAEAPALKK